MTKWIVAVVFAGGVLIAARAGGCLTSSKAPDEKLAGRFEDLCEIAGEHKTEPVAGVRALGRYMGKHFGDMYGEFGDTIALIEKIPDDAEHDERARLARDRWVAPWLSCVGEWMEFWEAVDADPEASELVNRAAERFQRTIEIIFGEGAGAVQLRDLPLRLTNVPI
jgi:hypothetical protein